MLITYVAILIIQFDCIGATIKKCGFSCVIYLDYSVFDTVYPLFVFIELIGIEINFN